MLAGGGILVYCGDMRQSTDKQGKRWWMVRDVCGEMGMKSPAGTVRIHVPKQHTSLRAVTDSQGRMHIALHMTDDGIRILLEKRSVFDYAGAQRVLKMLKKRRRMSVVGGISRTASSG